MDIDVKKEKETEDEHENRDIFNARQLAPYLVTPHTRIPEYELKIVKLVREWVSCKVYPINRCNEEDDEAWMYEDSADDMIPDVVPFTGGEPRTLAVKKLALLRCMDDPSQYKIVHSIGGYIDELREVRDVYVEWFYSENRVDEVTGFFNFITTEYPFDSVAEKEYKRGLIKLYNRIEPTNARREACIMNVDSFIESVVPPNFCREWLSDGK